MQLFIPKGVCAKEIEFNVEGGQLHNVRFGGGCDGNLKAVSALLEGMEVDEAVKRLGGIKCGKKNTSCPDQLCEALKMHAA